MKLVSFSNKRPQTGEQGSILAATQTLGKMRITGKVASIMGVIAGDYLEAVGDQETGKLYLHKGLKDDNTQIGNKLIETGNSFEFGSKNVWDTLRAKAEELVPEDYKANEDGAIKFEVSETPEEVGEEKYFEVLNPTCLPKRVRGESDNDEDEDEGQESVAENKSKPATKAVEEAVEEEAVEEVDDSFSLD